MPDSIPTNQSAITRQQALNDAVRIGKSYGKESVEIRNVAVQIMTNVRLGAAESLALRKLYLEIEDPSGEIRYKILNIVEFNNPREALYLRLSRVTWEASSEQRKSKSFFKQSFGQILAGLSHTELIELIDYICYEQPKRKIWLTIAAALRTMIQKSDFRQQHQEIYQRLKLAVINTAKQQKADENTRPNAEGTSSSARLASIDSEFTLKGEYGDELDWIEDAFGS